MAILLLATAFLVCAFVLAYTRVVTPFLRSLPIAFTPRYVAALAAIMYETGLAAVLVSIVWRHFVTIRAVGLVRTPSNEIAGCDLALSGPCDPGSLAQAPTCAATAVIVGGFWIDPQIQIVPHERVSTRTMGDPSPPHVLPLIDDLQMIRTKAGLVGALVVELFSLRDRADLQLVGDPMNEVALLSEGDDPVTLWVAISRPNPTPRRVLGLNGRKALVKSEPSYSMFSHTRNITTFDCLVDA